MSSLALVAYGRGHARDETTDHDIQSPSDQAYEERLTIPLMTLLGLAERPGEASGLGAIDPALARILADSAATNPRTTWCVTVTAEDGHPTAHGCARPAKGGRPADGRNRPAEDGPGERDGLSGPGGRSRARSTGGRGSRDGPGNSPGPGHRSGPVEWGGPGGRSRARSTRGTGSRDGPGNSPGPGERSGPVEWGGPGWRGGIAFTREQGSGPPEGHGRWRLQPGGGRELFANIEPLAILDCDHRHESAGYQPSDPLRHLVEIRDGECTYPPCRRTARRCDFEHAIPWDKGGRTCACNAGCRCRHHHLAKQAHGWRLQQNLPGYHTWTTPAGRTYTTGPVQYPV